MTISIDVLSNKSISNTVRTLLFEKRVEILLELLKKNNDISVEIKSKIESQMGRALKISRNVKNIITHNHILMELYKNIDDGALYEKEMIISSRNWNKKISIESMIEAANNTESLASEVSDTYLDMIDVFLEK